MGAHTGDLVAEMQESVPAPRQLDRLTSVQTATDEGEDSKAVPNRKQPFTDQRAAALALLNSDTKLTRKAGSFLGQCVADPAPLSDAQRSWLETLLDRADLPSLADGGEHD